MAIGAYTSGHSGPSNSEVSFWLALPLSGLSAAGHRPDRGAPSLRIQRVLPGHAPRLAIHFLTMWLIMHM